MTRPGKGGVKKKKRKRSSGEDGQRSGEEKLVGRRRVDVQKPR